MIICNECGNEMEDKGEVLMCIRLFICPACGEDRYVDEGEDDLEGIEQDEWEL